MPWISVTWIASLVVAYLVGSIPSAYLAGLLSAGRDIRDQGDRNPGAANAYRTISPRIGLAVGAVDVAKGAVAVIIARAATDSLGAGMAAGVVAVAGHNWPIFAQLRGGRGAATTVGVYLALMPLVAIPLGLFSFALLPFLRNVTLTLGMIMIPMPLLVWVTGGSTTLVIFSVAFPIMSGARHYFTTRKAQGLREDQAAPALPQE
ncbi:MAG: glycerol-3-phosphate acyltransferase [Dehalococcoidia bacterium]|nr:glycerol-3-phosphate acyltransferase [Dehalococcoidia bacterium]